MAGRSFWLSAVGGAIRAQVRDRVPECRVTVRKAGESSDIPPGDIPSRSRCTAATFARDAPTTENRGVPGSSPGLAILETGIPHGYGIFWLAVHYRLELPAPRVVGVTFVV